MRNYIVSVLVAFCILLVGISDDTWANNFGGGTCEGPSGCRRLHSEEICHAQCGTLKQGPIALMNPTTGECPPNTDPICSWNPLTCQQGATCSSDADCGGGGTCGGTELMPNDLQGLEWNSSHPSWNKLCKWDAMVPNTYTPIYYGGQVGPQAKTREFGVVASCSIADYNDPVWSEPGKKKVDYIDYCRNGVSNAGAIQVPLSGQQGQCGWQQAPKVCQCSSATCGPGESLQSVYMSAAFRHFERPTGSYGAKKIMAQYGTPYYTAASNIGEAINKVYSGWNFTYRGNSEFAAFWLENQFSPGVMMPHTIQGSKIHATEYAILNGNMSSVPGRITASHPGNGWDYYTASSLQQDDILGGRGGITVGALKSANPGLGRSSLYQDGVYVAGPYEMCVSTTPSSEPVCGSAHGVATATAPSGSALCSVGAPFGIVNGPQGNPASYTWLCQHNSKKVQCQAPYQPPVLAETCVLYQPSVHGNTAVALGSAKALGLSAVGTTIPSHPDVSVSTEDYQVLSGDLGSGSYLKVTFTNLFRPILIGPYMPQFIQHTNPANNNKFYGCNPADRNAANPGAWNTHFKVSCEVCTQSDYPDPICGDYQIETHTNTDITTPIPILQPVPTCWDHTDVFCFDKNGQKHYDVGYEVFYKTPFVNGGFYRSTPEGPQNVANGQTSDLYSCKITSKNQGKRIAEVSIGRIYSQGRGILDSDSYYYERESVKKIGNDCGDPTRVTTPITQISTLPIRGGNVLGLASRSKTKVVSTMKGNYPNPFNSGTTVIGSLSPSIDPDHAVASIVGGSCQVGQVMNWNPNTKRRQCVSGTKTVECPNLSYAWETGDWGVCTGGSQTRTVVCKDSTGAVVADNFCPSPKPTTTQSCTNQQGVCGPSHGRPFMTSFVGTNFAHVPGTPVPQITAGLCTSGTPSAITKVTPASGVQYWSWTCGSGQGQATCSSHVACNGVKACDDKTYCAGYIPPSAPRCENPSYDKINECRRQCRKNGPYDLVDSVDHTDEGNGGGYHNGNADFTHPACPPDYCIADANQSNCDRLEGTWNYGFAQNGLCTVCPGGNCYGTFNTAVEVGVQYCRNCDTPGDKGGYTTLFDGEYGGCNNAFSWDACYRSKGYRKNTMISSLRKIGETCLIGTPRGNAPNNGRVSSFGIGVGLVSPNKVCEPANLPGSNWSIREPGAGRYAQTLSIH